MSGWSLPVILARFHADIQQRSRLPDKRSAMQGRKVMQARVCG
jgi:hypothetical protein